MHILTRYVLLEFIKVFVVTLGAMTLLMIIVGVVREAHENGLGIAQVIQLIPFILPDSLRFTVPGTVLFAACSMYGRMAGGNEITAIKALGISPWVLIRPVLALVFLISLATVWLNDLAVTWGHGGVKRVILESVDDIAYGMLRVQRTYTSRQFSIHVKSVDGQRLIQPTISFAGRDNTPNVTIRALEAELRTDPVSNVLVISCTDAEVDVEGSARARLDHLVREIPLSQVGDDSSWSPSYMSLSEVGQKGRQRAAELREEGRNLAVKTAFLMLAGEFDELSSRERNSEAEQYKYQRFLLARFRAEPHRRWSNGFSCLCFLLVGMPMAIRLRNADLLTSFFFCFLPILIIYYPLFMWGVDRAKAGDMPPYTVWLGNVMLVAWGGWLVRHVWRY
jgi:lipopolysaccharide export system permease protein